MGNRRHWTDGLSLALCMLVLTVLFVAQCLGNLAEELMVDWERRVNVAAAAAAGLNGSRCILVLTLTLFPSCCKHKSYKSYFSVPK